MSGKILSPDITMEHEGDNSINVHVPKETILKEMVGKIE
jgi:hypothetical protein